MFFSPAGRLCTRYWTEVVAPFAKAVTATDYNPETLEIAAKRGLGSHVDLDLGFVERKALAFRYKRVYAEATPWDQSARRA